MNHPGIAKIAAEPRLGRLAKERSDRSRMWGKDLAHRHQVMRKFFSRNNSSGHVPLTDSNDESTLPIFHQVDRPRYTDLEDYRSVEEISSSSASESSHRELPDEAGAFPTRERLDGETVLQEPTVSRALLDQFEQEVASNSSLLPVNNDDMDQAQEEKLGPEMEEETHQLASAWFARRRTLHWQEQQQLSSPPVDCDSGQEWLSCAKMEEAEDAKDQTVDEDAKALPTIRCTDDKSAISGISAATSDQTPVVDNRRFLNTNARANVSSNSSTAGQTTSDDGDVATERPRRSGLFDLQTRQGKIVYFLILLLVLAVITILISGLHMQGSDNKDSESLIDNPVAPFAPNKPFNTAPSRSPTVSDGVPTRAPDVPPAYDNQNKLADPNTSPAPVSNDTLPVDAAKEATSAPTRPKQDVALKDSPRPSLSPSIALSNVPTEIPTRVPTRSPTEKPTQMPSRFPTITPTRSPTQMPSTRPSATPTTRPTGQPSSRPTPQPTPIPSGQPTTRPTVAPTKSLASLEFSFTDYFDGDRDRDTFGSTVAVSGDASVMVVGAPNADIKQPDGTRLRVGAVRIFDSIESNRGKFWVERSETLTGVKAQDAFGSSVAINYDGSVIACSEPTHDGAGDKSGRVRVFQFDARSKSYVPLGQDLAGPAISAFFGVGLAISGDGTRLAVGAPYLSTGKLRMQGAVYVHELRNGQWVLLGEPLSGTGTLDWFGSAVALSQDGLTVVASAPRSSLVRGYVRSWMWNDDQNAWTRLGNDIVNYQGTTLATDRFGHSISLSKTGSTRIAIGVPFKSIQNEPNAGIVVIYELDADSRWKLLGSPILGAKSGDNFGYSVGFAKAGTIAIGAPGANPSKSGSVFIFRFTQDTNAWEKHPTEYHGELQADQFGYSVALAGEEDFVLVIGAKQTIGGTGYVKTFETS